MTRAEAIDAAVRAAWPSFDRKKAERDASAIGAVKAIGRQRLFVRRVPPFEIIAGTAHFPARSHLEGYRNLIGPDRYADGIWRSRDIDQAARNRARSAAWVRDRLREVSP